MAAKAPGATEVRNLYDQNVVSDFFEGLDDIIDDGVGFRPFRPVARIWKFVAPANVIYDKTKVPKPWQVAEQLQDQIEGAISSAFGRLGAFPGGFKLPPIPKFPALPFG